MDIVLPKLKITLIFLAVAASFSGCTFGFRHGDATVTRHPQFLHFGQLDGYEVTFPAVPLSRAGTTTFNRVHLPSGSYGYSYKATGGSRRSDVEFHRGDRTLAEVHRPNAVVNVRAVSPDGKILFQEDVSIGNLDWDHSGGSAMIPLHVQTVSPATDFQLAVTVVTPAANPKEKIQVIGFADR